MGAGTSSGKAGKSQLPPLADNIVGIKREFHETMNSAEARGANQVSFTGGIQEDKVGIQSNWGGYYVAGSYEILKAGNQLERVKGYITTTKSGRLIGISEDASAGYRVTDLRTGMLITPPTETLGQATYAADTAASNIQSQMASGHGSVASAEDRFRKAHH